MPHGETQPLGMLDRLNNIHIERPATPEFARLEKVDALSATHAIEAVHIVILEDNCNAAEWY